MAGSGPADLYNAANEYLEACINALQMSPGGIPERCYVSPGAPIWDCPEMLCVHIGGPAIADTLPLQPSLAPLHRVSVQGEVNLITLTATILRCWPIYDDAADNLPSIESYTEVSQVMYTDLWAIWQYGKAAHRQGILFPGKQRQFGFDPAISVNMQGGTVGWEIPLRVSLEGFSIELLAGGVPVPDPGAET